MPLLLRGIGIQSFEASGGEEVFDLLFHQLGSIPAVADIEGVTLWTRGELALGVPTVVASESAFGLMVGQRNITVGTTQFKPTALAVKEVGKTPSVKKENHLFVGGECFLHQ